MFYVSVQINKVNNFFQKDSNYFQNGFQNEHNFKLSDIEEMNLILLKLIPYAILFT